MTISQQSVDCCQTFAESYELSNLKPMLEIEKRVLGCDYGGTSWTTRAQADQAISLLGLSPDAHLLDIGSGSGWPALYLCGQSGARLTMLDVTVNALQMATERAGRDGLESRVNVIAASADALPFAKGSFDRISHSDVLCCLPEKERMLDECRRVAAPGAQMLFAVIYVAEGLQPAAHQRVVEAG